MLHTSQATAAAGGGASQQNEGLLRGHRGRAGRGGGRGSAEELTLRLQNDLNKLSIYPT